MQIDQLTSNNEALAEVGRRIKAQRIALPLTQAQLAQRAGVSLRTVANLERGSDVTLSSLLSVMRALSLLSRLDVALPQEEMRPSDVLAGKPPRQRVRPARKKNDGLAWRWGDEQ